MHKYLPHTKSDIKDMLDTIGAPSLEHLFHNIPDNLKLKKRYDIPESYSDIAITTHMHKLAGKNDLLDIYRGYGAYDHYTPSIVKSLTSRQEFLTSYTPYQPEVSQGTLQYIFEYQSMICELTGMDVSNASMYDGPTATAEAMFMALAATGKKKIILSHTINPNILEVVKTYGHYRNVDFVFLPEKDGITDFSTLENHLEDAAGLIIQTPNKYGIIENLTDIDKRTKAFGATYIINSDAQSLAILKNQNSWGADIACGDLQSLGVPLSYGGAYIGYLACKTPYLRKMPGRICGVTEDVDGKRAFVLTLQAREQHIRRAKANSNICSNQSLMALSVAIYLSTLGKKGFVDVANYALDGAHYLANELIKTGHFKLKFNQPFFKEFLLDADFDMHAFNDFLLKKHILGPLNFDTHTALFAVTEKKSKQDLDQFVALVGEFVNEIL